MFQKYTKFCSSDACLKVFDPNIYRGHQRNHNNHLLIRKGANYVKIKYPAFAFLTKQVSPVGSRPSLCLLFSFGNFWSLSFKRLNVLVRRKDVNYFYLIFQTIYYKMYILCRTTLAILSREGVPERWKDVPWGLEVV